MQTKHTLKTALTLGLSLLLLTSACKKVEVEEPRRFGDGTISFFVDGKLWQNSNSYNNTGSINGTGNSSSSFYSKPEKGIYTVFGRIWEEEVSMFYIAMVNQNKESTYYLQNGNGVITYPADPLDANHMTLWISKSNKTYISKEGYGWVKQTVIFSDSTHTGVKDRYGTFEVTLFNESNSNDFIQITDGRFNN
tara:strand:+ start:310 stop:888 length:579 start_codon:yes stop_codon:yes gene_type:complete